MRKQRTILINAKKTDFMNAVSKFEYTINMMCREQILLMQKNRFDYCEIQT